MQAASKLDRKRFESIGSSKFIFRFDQARVKSGEGDMGKVYQARDTIQRGARVGLSLNMRFIGVSGTNSSYRHQNRSRWAALRTTCRETRSLPLNCLRFSTCSTYPRSGPRSSSRRSRSANISASVSDSKALLAASLAMSRLLTGVPHPVLWTQVNATPPGVARAPRGPRSACDTRASRAARSCCTAPRTRSLRRVPP